jgi:hypothetical protein
MRTLIFLVALLTATILTASCVSGGSCFNPQPDPPGANCEPDGLGTGGASTTTGTGGLDGGSDAATGDGGPVDGGEADGH